MSPRATLLEMYPDVEVKVMNLAHLGEFFDTGFFFLTFIAEATGTYDGASDFTGNFTLPDEANIIFQYAFCIF